LIAVESESTGAYDRGDKFRLSRDIESLQQYVLVNSINLGDEVFRRMDDNHRLLPEDAYKLIDSGTIGSMGATIILADIYRATDNVKEGCGTRQE
jgi:Uma2 family endonuclease